MSVKEIRDVISQASDQLAKGPFSVLRALTAFAGKMHYINQSSKSTNKTIEPIASQFAGDHSISEKQLLLAQKEVTDNKLNQLNEQNFDLKSAKNHKNNPPTPKLK